MNVPGAQPGYGRFSKLALLLFIGGLGYAGVTFWPVGKSYYSIKQDARRLAIRTAHVGEDPETEIQRFIAAVNNREKLQVTRTDIAFSRQDERAEVSVRLRLPVNLPGLHKHYLWTTVVTAEARQARGY